MEPVNLFGSIGYGFAAALYLLLTLLLLTSWRGRMLGGLLVLATFASGLWAAFLAVQAVSFSLSVTWLWALEALRNLAWIFFLLRLVRRRFEDRQQGRRLFRLLEIAALGLALILAMPIEHLAARSEFLAGLDLFMVRLALQVLFPVAGLVLVEQVYRNTPWQHRWGVKFLCLGVGGMFAYDFFFFADALLFRRLDLDIWLARGAVNALVVPLIALSAARSPQWSLDLSVSRKVAFHTTSLVAAGIYLLIMSLVGYYIRHYGGAWSAVLQTVFFFGAGLVLIILLFSGHFRARVKVFVSKHFFSYKYDYREEWLHLISVLSGKVLEATLPERIVFALGEMVDSPGGALWVCSDQAPCEYQRAWNLPEEVLDRGESFACMREFLSIRQWIVDLEEYERDPQAYDGLTLPPWLLECERLWLVVPLFHESTLMAIVVLAKPRAAQQLNWETLDLLKMAARLAASYLALEEAAKALADARQFEGFNRLSAFVVHDLKNLIAQLSLVTRNAERHRHNPAFVEDAMATIRNSVDKMTRLLTQLRSAMPASRSDPVDLAALLGDVVAERSCAEPRPRLEPTGVSGLVVYADKDRLSAVIGHIIQNAQEATPRDGSVLVRLHDEGRQVRIEVEDDGVGMDATFVRERLFKPFDSTKGLAGMGIGAYECREFIRSLGGHIEVRSEPGAGTCFAMMVPLEPNVDRGQVAQQVM